MSDEHGTAVAVLEHAPVERMHPMVSAMLSGQQLDTQTMRELMELQREWERDEARKAFDAALVRLKEDLPSVIGHDKRVNVTTRSGSKIQYSHASLAGAMDEITGPLTRNGFSLSWRTSNTKGEVSVRCVLTHAQGHSTETELSAPPDTSGTKNPVQAVASTVTYLKRYTALTLLGIATADMGDPEPPQADPDTVNEALNVRAVANLRKYGKTREAAEERIGKPAKEWTRRDLDAIGEWVREQTRVDAERFASEDSLPPFDEGEAEQ